MKQPTAILASLLLAALPAFAGTAPKNPPSAPPMAPEPTFSYNNLEAGWTYRDFDGFDNTNGYYLYASYSPIDSFFVFAEWGQDFGDDLDRDLFAPGIGVYIPLVSKVHWVTTVGAGYVNTDAAGADDDSWAFNASTGLRIMICARAELELAYNFSVDGDDDDHSASAGVLIGLTENLQLTTRGYFSNDENGLAVGLRYNF